MNKKIIHFAMLVLASSVSAGTINVNFSGLEDLGPDARYEGWLIVGGNPVSTGVFTVDGSGIPSPSSFTVSDADADNATTFVLTIEPFPDVDPAPASTHILAGDFANGVANITVDHPAAIGTDFAAAAGDYILAVPSDSNMVGSYVNGIWYLTPPNPDPSLNLPTLPPGWAYEGWVVDTNANMPISTGTFTSVSGADSDGGGSTAGPGVTPPFPGQDFINPLRDLTNDHLAVISVEPVPDNSPMPFTLKPLAGSITDPGGAGISQSLGNNAAATNPTGVVSIFGSPNAVPSLGFYGMLLLIFSVGFLTFRQKQVIQK